MSSRGPMVALLTMLIEEGELKKKLAVAQASGYPKEVLLLKRKC